METIYIISTWYKVLCTHNKADPLSKPHINKILRRSLHSNKSTISTQKFCKCCKQISLATCLISYLASRLLNLKFHWLSLVRINWEIVLEICNSSIRIKWSLRKMLYLSSSMPSNIKKQIKQRINNRKSNDFWGLLFIIMKKYWQIKDSSWTNGKHSKDYSKKIKRTK